MVSCAPKVPQVYWDLRVEEQMICKTLPSFMPHMFLNCRNALSRTGPLTSFPEKLLEVLLSIPGTSPPSSPWQNLTYSHTSNAAKANEAFEWESAAISVLGAFLSETVRNNRRFTCFGEHAD